VITVTPIGKVDIGSVARIELLEPHLPIAGIEEFDPLPDVIQEPPAAKNVQNRRSPPF